MSNIEQIKTKLIQAKEAYYNSDSPIMSDTEFDKLEEQLKMLDPSNDYFSLIGITPYQGRKIKHEIPMLSQMKAKTVNDVFEWQRKNLKDDSIKRFLIEPKIDGLSCAIVYEYGNLKYISTRGDGIDGQNVTHIKDYINTGDKLLPQEIKFFSEHKRIEIRGELVILKDNKFFNSVEHKNRRNLVAGLINRKTELEDLKNVSFIAYQLFGLTGLEYEGDKLHILNSFFYTPDSFLFTEGLENGWLDKFFDKYVSFYRNDWNFETDGLVIVVDELKRHEEINQNYVIDHHNYFSIALKPSAETAQTTLKEVVWQMSRQGALIPVAIFEPIDLVGATITKASLYNWDQFYKFNFNPGDQIIVSRRNDVIPAIEQNLTKNNCPSPEFLPKKCPFCGSKVEKVGVHLKCTNPITCTEQQIQKVIYWIKQCEFEEVSEKTIRTLFENGIIYNINDLYFLPNKPELVETMKGLIGFGEKTVKNLLYQIEQSKNMTIIQFIGRLGIPLVQEKSVKNLEIKSYNEFLNFKDTSYIMGQNLINFRKENMDFISELYNALKVSDIKEETQNKIKVCMTGSDPFKLGRKALIEKIEQKGYEFSETVTKEVKILICEDVNGNSGKLQKARKDGVTLMSYEEFFK